jgi:hypothetical protein
MEISSPLSVDQLKLEIVIKLNFIFSSPINNRNNTSSAREQKRTKRMAFVSLTWLAAAERPE